MVKKIIKPILLSMLMLLCICNKSFAYQISDDSKNITDTPYYVDYQYAHSDYLVTKENKVWTIKLNDKITITNNTYKCIYVLDNKNNKIPIVLKTKNNKKSDNEILVYPKTNYLFENKYLLVVDKGLEGENNTVTKEKIIKKFQIAPKATYNFPRGCDILSSNRQSLKDSLKEDYVYLNLPEGNSVSWLPVEWHYEDIDLIPIYCTEPRVQAYTSEEGVFYIRGRLAGFDPKEPAFNFKFRMNITH